MRRMQKVKTKLVPNRNKLLRKKKLPRLNSRLPLPPLLLKKLLMSHKVAIRYLRSTSSTATGAS